MCVCVCVYVYERERERERERNKIKKCSLLPVNQSSQSKNQNVKKKKKRNDKPSKSCTIYDNPLIRVSHLWQSLASGELSGKFFIFYIFSFKYSRNTSAKMVSKRNQLHNAL